MSPKDEQQHHAAIDFTHLESVEKILTATSVDHKFKMKDSDFQALRKLPGNASCIDCGTADPDWASVNLGVFVCLSCSGQHRALGTHVSFVRSVEMDSWSDIQLKKMYMGGNDQCSEFLQKHGVTEQTASGDKYDTPAAHLYQKVLSARIKGEPEPTELPVLPKKKAVQSKSIRLEGFGSPLPEEQPNGIVEFFRSMSLEEDDLEDAQSPRSPSSPSSSQENIFHKLGFSKFMGDTNLPDLEMSENDISERCSSDRFSVDSIIDEAEEEEDEDDDEDFDIDDLVNQFVEDNDTGFSRNSRWSMATKEFKSQRMEESKEEDIFKKIGMWFEENLDKLKEDNKQ